MSSYSRQIAIDFGLRVSQGAIGGYSSEFKFARSSLIGTAESVVWDGGGDYTWLTAAEKVSLVSTATTDEVAGVGARSILIAGLDADFNPISEIIIPTGITPVVSQLEYLRLYRAMVLTSGTDSAVSDGNKGDISIKGNVSTLVTLAKILIGNGQTLMSPFTVPAGKTAYITGVTLSAGEGKQCTFKLKYRNGIQSDNAAFSVKYAIEVFENAFNPVFSPPLQISEKIDVCLTASTTVGTIDASASYGLILVDNEK